MAKIYTVTGPVVTAKVGTLDGQQVRYFYRGAVLPNDVDPATLEHLLDVGLVTEFGSSDDADAAAGAALTADPNGLPVEPFPGMPDEEPVKADSKKARA